MSNDDNYGDLAAAAERGELTPVPNGSLRGAEAAAEGRAALLAATGADTVDEARRFAISDEGQTSISAAPSASGRNAAGRLQRAHHQ